MITRSNERWVNEEEGPQNHNSNVTITLSAVFNLPVFQVLAVKSVETKIYKKTYELGCCQIKSWIVINPLNNSQNY